MYRFWSYLRVWGYRLLGYTQEDLQEMIQAVDASLTQVDDTDDPWLHSRLAMTHSLLSGLWAEGYFD
jgi:hypothetical protein